MIKIREMMGNEWNNVNFGKDKGDYMATTKDFIEFVCEQIHDVGAVRYRKMFGEYMVYVNDKPILLVCDDTVYVKKYESIQKMMEDADKGSPYEGAKEHYILDIDNADLCKEIIKELEPNIQVPKPKKKKQHVSSS
jgi:TfoX/Sxy family transcriptional regulator of competence genes